jgi:hypothetical protein
VKPSMGNIQESINVTKKNNEEAIKERITMLSEQKVPKMRMTTGNIGSIFAKKD